MTIITDMTHLLDSAGRLSSFTADVWPAKYLGAIVEALTTEPSNEPRELGVKCRKRPKRTPCKGKIHGSFESGTMNLLWFCPVCGDNGMIHHWQDTPWDRGGRASLPFIQRIWYRGGFVDDLSEVPTIKARILEGPSIGEDLVRAINDNELLGADGVYGNHARGEPIQFDHLIIDHPEGSTELILYNRAIMLFMTDVDLYKRIHRVCCMIEKSGELSAG